ncbi:MAG TPA: hypothetical protein VIM11_21810 [Tepidisphaeraceae bacterium]|jgi:hypothetical protein
MTAASAARATVFASSVVADQSSGFVSGWPNPLVALGAPSRINGVGSGFDAVMNPFNANWEASDIVEIAPGGQLTLQFPNFVNVGGGSEIGVISYTFFIDSGLGANLNPAQTYSKSAEVRVSDDGVTWHSIGTHAFNHPANAYSDATSSFQSTPGSSPTDFGIPLTTPLSAFDGKTFAETLALYGNSGGGTWLDLSSSGLTKVDYIQFRTTTDSLAIDAVSLNNADIGAAVPEPAMLSFLLLTSLSFIRRRR